MKECALLKVQLQQAFGGFFTLFMEVVYTLAPVLPLCH